VLICGRFLPADLRAGSPNVPRPPWSSGTKNPWLTAPPASVRAGPEDGPIDCRLEVHPAQFAAPTGNVRLRLRVRGRRCSNQWSRLLHRHVGARRAACGPGRWWDGETGRASSFRRVAARRRPSPARRRSVFGRHLGRRWRGRTTPWAVARGVTRSTADGSDGGLAGSGHLSGPRRYRTAAAPVLRLKQPFQLQKLRAWVSQARR